MENCIRVQGARVNNLKNISVEIPRDKLVVLTGLSGSGKSSLAFDTIFAEGQRRYVESLSSYARMFLGQMDKPDVDSIDGLSPAISIDQKTTSRNPRSTVGTVTEIYDYLRLLWARCGTPHCPKCGKEIRRQTVDQIVDQIMGLPDRTKFQILSPVVRGKKGEHQKVFEDARRSGYARVRVDGSLYELTEDIALDKNKKHHIEVVVDRLIMKPDLARRLTDSVETASNLSGGLVILNELDGDKDTLFSQNYACEDCGISMPELSPRMFSFNNPYGACPVCAGLGTQQVADPLLIIPDRSKSILQGAIQASGWNNVRDSKLHIEKYLKENMEAEFGYRTENDNTRTVDAAQKADGRGTTAGTQRDGHGAELERAARNAGQAVSAADAVGHGPENASDESRSAGISDQDANERRKFRETGWEPEREVFFQLQGADREYEALPDRDPERYEEAAFGYGSRTTRKKIIGRARGSRLRR